MERVSDHFSLEEVTHTDTGLENVIQDGFVPNAVRLAETVLEPWRVLVGPLQINSWFRSRAVNKAVGGEMFSAHLEARAADCVPRGNLLNAFKMLIAGDIPFDKAILEPGWIHVQVAPEGQEPRKHTLEGIREGSRIVYKAFNA